MSVNIQEQIIDVQTGKLTLAGFKMLKSLEGGGGGGGASTWGAISGTLSAQTDLALALNGKLPLTGGTLTGPLTTEAASPSGAGFNLPPGLDPSSPNDGDIWMNAASMRVRINSTNYSFVFTNGAQTFTGKKTFSAATLGGAFLNVAPGVAPSAPVNGDVWMETGAMFARIGGVSKRLDPAPTEVTVTFTELRQSAFFDVTVTGAAVGQRVMACASLDMPAGVAEDEIEMDPLTVSGRVVSADTVRLLVAANGPIIGARNVNVMVG